MKFDVSHIVSLIFLFALLPHCNYLHSDLRGSHRIPDNLSECKDLGTMEVSRNRTYGLINTQRVVRQGCIRFHVIGRFTICQISHPAHFIKESLLFMFLKSYSGLVSFVFAPKSYHQPSHLGEVLKQEGPQITTRIMFDTFKKVCSEGHVQGMNQDTLVCNCLLKGIVHK